LFRGCGIVGARKAVTAKFAKDAKTVDGRAAIHLALANLAALAVKNLGPRVRGDERGGHASSDSASKPRLRIRAPVP
jgi:hypothetical protein